MSHAKRSRARHHAVQAIYQWQVAGGEINDIFNQFIGEEDVERFDVGYFQDLLAGVPKHLGQIDAALAPCLDRTIESVDPVERAILRLGAYEMVHHPEIPYRVVINEAVELAKTFGAEKGHRFVNGVLDRFSKDARKHEPRP